MKLILLSGGSGKRLWPLSNDSRSKQFLKVLQDETGQCVSMVQRVWRQLDNVNLQKDTIIATSKAQAEILRNQLGADINLVVEPSRRDTFPAIALASSYLYSVMHVDPGETVVILPVDPYVEIGYFHQIKELDVVLQKSKANMTLMGVEPTFPSEKYGYIVPDMTGETGDYFVVSHFKEKPEEEEARELMAKKALWNCGVFAFSLEYMLGILQKWGYPTEYEELYEKYDMLPKISFDYEVVEKASKIVVVPYSGGWKDLGTWITLTEEMSTQILGKGTISHDSQNSHIVNELDIPIAVLGVPNIVVAASPDGILVTDKSESPRVKEIVAFDQRPMYEERRWGWYKVLDYTKYSYEDEVLTKRVCIYAGKNLSYHLHRKRSEVWTILKGEGEFVQEGKYRKVSKGDVIAIPKHSKHAIKASTDLEFIEVQRGTELVESDVYRYHMVWDEIMKSIEVNN